MFPIKYIDNNLVWNKDNDDNNLVWNKDNEVFLLEATSLYRP